MVTPSPSTAAGLPGRLSPMNSLRCLVLCLFASAQAAFAANHVTVTVTHDLGDARPSETITVPWAEVNKAIPGALLQRIAVKDAIGRVLPYQVIDIAPQAK